MAKQFILSISLSEDTYNLIIDAKRESKLSWNKFIDKLLEKSGFKQRVY